MQVPYNATASADNPDAAAVNFESFAIPGLVDNLQVGTNYLVIQGIDGANSSDFLIDVELAFTTLQSNTDVHIYSGPITIDDNTRINARTVVGNTWSAMASATYVTNVPQLAITEINYNPGAPTPSELTSLRTVQNDDFEFIELKNVGSQPIQLVGTHFSDGVEFEFPNITLQPNEYGVVVANAAAFRLRYGDGIRMLGEYAGSLNNGGEKLGLASADGTVLLEFDFEDTALWPQAADGVGASLELIDANTPADQFGKHYRWRSSTENGGSPGDAGQGRVGIVINEILSHTDAPLTESDSIELLNVTNAPIDIGGWFLSDSASNLFKYQIPDGTVVNAGSYVVFSEEDFNPTPLSPQQNHFALNGAEGDEVWLTQAADGTVEAFVDNVRFGATLNNESLGRIPNGSGYLTPLQQTTLGQANRNPRIGPAIISEVNYNPGTPSPSALVVDPTLTSDDLEYVEIFNSLRQPIDLTRWRIRGGVDFDFADGESLGASQALLVLSFNPDKPENADRLAAFRTHYGLDAAVRLVGGYSGKLSDGSDRIVLQSPDEPPVEDPSLYPRIQQDEVVYDDLAPWANADGNGMSLHRAAVNALGNAASSWLSGDPSPGTAQLDVVEVPGDFNLDGQVNADDINLLCVQLGSATPDMAFDLTGDANVNEADRDYLVRNVLRTDYGDANLDGVFNSSDLILVFQAGQYEDAVAGNSGWAEGDWNCDGDFNTSDMILAFQAGSYSSAAESSQANLQQLPDTLTAAAVWTIPAGETLRVKTPVASSVVDVPVTERADVAVRRLWKQATVVDQVFGQPERTNSLADPDSALTDAAFVEDKLHRFFL
ncbi:MAG: lamin tail domain-containing protein [Pirellulaceae bacterium]